MFLVVGSGRPVSIPYFVVGVEVPAHNCVSLGAKGFEEVADSGLSTWRVEAVDGLWVLGAWGEFDTLEAVCFAEG